KTAEDVVAVFEDFNGDGHLDLYVGSGGNAYGPREVFNFDRIYLNDGKGNLLFSMNSLPPLGENTSTVAVHDVNGDGFPDIFVGASVVIGNYGASSGSHLLMNDGKGRFRDVTHQYFGEDLRPGMVQKAIWEDITGNGHKELLLTGEWMGVQVYTLNASGQFERLQDLAPAGWYYAMHVVSGGKMEDRQLVLGNLGLNSKLKASLEKPLWLYHGDFDGNGQEDPLLFHYMGDKLVPFGSRDDLIKQIPGIKRKHDTYKSYAGLKSPQELLEKSQLEAARKVAVKELRSGSISFDNSAQVLLPFPVEAQFSPLRDFVDFTSGGSQYLLGVGNFYGFRNDLGKAGAYPMVLLKRQNKEWVHIPLGLNASAYWGEFRKVAKIEIKGKLHLIALKNNGPAVVMEIID
ncbi:MAG: VCBS repeat-containing protein, partial [Cyclobacteriaceae bacterium]|nr:VCBS repeat-containing protein [Cyclobacteriaceae bacterium]